MAGIVQIQLPSARNSITESTNENDESVGSGSNSSNSNSAYISSTASASATHGLAPPLWTHRVSASFNAMAEQIAAASQAIAMIPPLPDAVYSALSTRLEAVERAQETLGDEFREVKERLEQMEMGKSINNNITNGEGDKSSVAKEGDAGAGNTPQEGIEKLEKILKEQADLLKLECVRVSLAPDLYCQHDKFIILGNNVSLLDYITRL